MQNIADPGELNRWVLIEAPKESAPTSAGEVTTTWEPWQGTWVKFFSDSSSELTRAKQLIAELTHLVATLYVAGLSTRMRIKYGTRVLAIQGIEDPGEAHEELLISCVEQQT